MIISLEGVWALRVPLTAVLTLVLSGGCFVRRFISVCVSPGVTTDSESLVQVTHKGQDFASAGTSFIYRARGLL
jgi:hypothetical protein